MGWEEKDNVEAMMETICDLHDKISDAIHSVCRTHFLKSIKIQTQPLPEKKRHHHRLQMVGGVDGEYDGRSVFVFVKEFMIGGGGGGGGDGAMSEARSLNAIRNALENLEDHLEFFPCCTITSTS